MGGLGRAGGSITTPVDELGTVGSLLGRNPTSFVAEAVVGGAPISGRSIMTGLE